MGRMPVLLSGSFLVHPRSYRGLSSATPTLPRAVSPGGRSGGRGRNASERGRGIEHPGPAGPSGAFGASSRRAAGPDAGRFFRRLRAPRSVVFRPATGFLGRIHTARRGRGSGRVVRFRHANLVAASERLPAGTSAADGLSACPKSPRELAIRGFGSRNLRPNTARFAGLFSSPRSLSAAYRSVAADPTGLVGMDGTGAVRGAAFRLACRASAIRTGHRLGALRGGGNRPD
jgi:hypothetical protein